MILLQLVPPGPVTFSSRIKSYLTASTLLLLALLLFCPNSLAQGIKLRPVPRLISDPVADADYSGPRRVTIGDNAEVVGDPGLAASPSIDEATSIERSAFEKTNQARVENGKAPLAWDSELCRLARAHSERMARQGFFSHETPEGLQLKDRARVMGIPRFRVIGENIAYNKGYEDPGSFAVERWMNSSGHRANILYVGFQASAIGSYVSGDGSVYLTQIFISR